MNEVKLEKERDGGREKDRKRQKQPAKAGREIESEKNRDIIRERMKER